ncbi:MAG: SBBP repeat-containing protein, partial [Acidobacteriia bacterium]|nr:SBBP repeat-containing protein [Terriglobia bacterium]
MLRKLPRQAARASFVIVVGALCPILHGAAQPWFEPNRGQLQRPIAFTARAQGYTVAFHSDGSATYVLGSTGSPEIIHMKLLGAPGRVSVSGSGALASVTRYYRDTAFFEIPHYSGISYRGIYKDIDLLWHARGADLEYEFQLAAGADPQALRLAFTGGKRVAVDPSGDLVVTTASGELRYRNPEGWQESGGQRLPVSVSFQLHSGTVRFAVGPHDIKLPLVIDPVLKYSTYLGGSGNDAAYAVATDSAGNVYTTGETASYDFPPAVGSAVRGAQAVFITKLSADESQVLFTTILVSSANSAGRSLALDGSGNIWVAGIVGGIGFPATANALNRISNGGQDAFVAELDPTGKLSYATYFGGAGTDAAMGIAVDTTGVYLTGYTASTNFPVTPGAPQASFQGGFYDAFISKLNPTGSAMLYSTYLGGTGNDTAAAIAVDVRGDACIAGRTDSPSLPLSNAIQAYAGDGDILLACLNPPGNGWSMLTYLGGSGADEANALALDSAGNIYLTGDTFSQDFPVTAGAYQTVSAGNYDAFALKLTSGNTIAFSTLLGGVGADSGTAIAVDAAGTVWLAGYTSSPNFPATMPPNFGGVFDGFIAALAPNGNSLLVASYLGGAGDDRCLGMVLSPAEEPVLVGSTGSVNFPVTAGVVQSTAPVPYNGFVSQWRLSPTVSIDTPVAGSVISGMVTISGWAIDNTATAGTAISSVQVLVDGTLVGNATYRISRP